MQIVHVKKRRARKPHECNACLFLFSGDYRHLGATFTEYRAIIAAKKANGVIQRGEVYNEVILADGCYLYRVREKPDIAAICRKYELYHD